jgi:hypothetical protein
MAPEVNAPTTMCLIILVVFMSLPLFTAAPEATNVVCLLLFDASGNFPGRAVQLNLATVATDPNSDISRVCVPPGELAQSPENRVTQ